MEADFTLKPADACLSGYRQGRNLLMILLARGELTLETELLVMLFSINMGTAFCGAASSKAVYTLLGNESSLGVLWCVPLLPPFPPLECPEWLLIAMGKVEGDPEFSAQLCT
eukprot:9166212-Ditylum_brightwellii.AAC.1